MNFPSNIDCSTWLIGNNKNQYGDNLSRNSTSLSYNILFIVTSDNIIFIITSETNFREKIMNSQSNKSETVLLTVPKLVGLSYVEYDVEYVDSPCPRIIFGLREPLFLPEDFDGIIKWIDSLSVEEAAIIQGLEFRIGHGFPMFSKDNTSEGIELKRDRLINVICKKLTNLKFINADIEIVDQFIKYILPIVYASLQSSSPLERLHIVACGAMPHATSTGLADSLKTESSWYVSEWHHRYIPGSQFREVT